MAKQKKGGGGKLSRSETVTVRLDPKLRFVAELAARKHRRTLSSFIEWAVEEAIQEVSLLPGETAYHAMNIAWDVDESERFTKLALHYPNLLTHDEEVLWKLICENGYLWKGSYKDNYNSNKSEWTWKVCPNGLVVEHLRKYWKEFQAVANEETSKDCLPTWLEEKEIEAKEPDDDIPF